MGRQIPSFRRLLLAEIERLYKRLRPKLRDPRLQEAFDALITVWSRESPSRMVSNLSTHLDAMNLLASVGTKAELEQLNEELQKLQNQASLLTKFMVSCIPSPPFPKSVYIYPFHPILPQLMTSVGGLDVGTSVIKYGETVDEVLIQIGKAILDAFPLQADSDVGLVNPTLKIGKIFQANITWELQGEQPVPEDVEFEEVSEGNIGLPATVASIFGDKPEDNSWVGFIHFS